MQTGQQIEQHLVPQLTALREQFKLLQGARGGGGWAGYRLDHDFILAEMTRLLSSLTTIRRSLRGSEQHVHLLGQCLQRLTSHVAQYRTDRQEQIAVNLIAELATAAECYNNLYGPTLQHSPINEADEDRARAMLADLQRAAAILDQQVDRVFREHDQRKAVLDAWLEESRSSTESRVKDLLQRLGDEGHAASEHHRQAAVKAATDTDEAARKSLATLAGYEVTAKALVATVENKTLTTDYAQEAHGAEVSAASWQKASITMFAIAVLVALGMLAYEFFKPGELSFAFVMTRLVAVGSIGLLGAFFSSRSRDNRRWARLNKRMQLNLATLEPYLERIDDPAERRAVRLKLVERFFDPTNEPDAEKPTDPALLKAALEPVLELIKVLNKK